VKKTILMADDADIVVNLGRALFNREGCEVLTASDGTEALRLCRERHPDIALIDLRMPGLDGFALLAELKGDAATADIPVVVFSGSTRAEERERCLHAGAVDFLSKPLRLEDLLRKTARILDIPIRRHVRVPVKLTIHGNGGEGGFEAESRDISSGGLFVASSASLKLDSEIALRFRLPYQTRDIEVTGRVVREVPPMPTRGYGISFVDLPPAVAEQIDRFVSGLER